MSLFDLARVIVKSTAEENDIWLTDEEIDKKTAQVVNHYQDIQYVKKILGIK